MNIIDTLENLVNQTAFLNLTVGNYIMIAVACIFLYLAIKKEYEPLLLVPIAFGMLLVNMYPDIMKAPVGDEAGGLLHYFYILDEYSILPSLIFMGVGAMTDFGPLIANPKSFLLGAAAQFGIYSAYFLAIFMGFGGKAAAAISIIGGADGPTSIFLAGKLGQTDLLGPIAVAAYSYMALVPIIQPPIMKLLTTEKERKIKMEQLRPVSKLEKILFPVIVTIVVVMILPTTAPLVGMLMLGNLFRESGVVKQLTDTASNALMYIVVILLGTNDTKENNWDKDKFINDYSEIINSYLVLESAPKVYILTPPPLFEVRGKILYDLRKSIVESEVVPAIKNIAKAKGVDCIDIYKVFDGKRELFADGVHPNVKGSELLAQSVFEKLSNN